MRKRRYRWRALAVGALVVGLAAVHPAGARAGSTVQLDGTIYACSQAGLNAAIAAAGSGGTVQFTVDCSMTLTSTITLSQSVTIDGNGHAVNISGGHTSTVPGVLVFSLSNPVTVTLNDLTIANGHSAFIGGGINNTGRGNLTVTNSTFSGNSASDSGGGINNNGGGNLTVTNSTFSGNSAIDGGGIFINGGGNLTVTDSTFTGNSATEGGGIFKVSGMLTVTNSTFSGNSATGHGGGIVNTITQPVHLANTILAGSTGGNCLGTFADNGGSLADDGTCGVTQKSSAQINLGPLAGNGGPTQTIALLPGSVAIDSTTCLQSTDQRGVARPDNGEAKCDAGAYEFQDPPADTTAPSCLIKGTISTGNGGIVIGTQDADGGLKATTGGTFTSAPSPAGGIQLTEVGNASVTIPAVVAGASGEVDVTALKVKAGVASRVSLAVTDQAGNVTLCDPVLLQVTRATSQPTRTTANGIARSEHLLHIYNGDPGLSHLTLTINGNTVRQHELVANQQYLVDIGAWLQPGSSNTVTIIARGKPRGEATIVIANA